MATTSRWIARLRPLTAPRARLFCFPYAGGGAKTYVPLVPSIAESIEVCAIEYPGRGTRFGERPLVHMEDVASGLGQELQPWLDLPYAFFGYSMGAFVAFETTRWLRARSAPAPKALLVAAARAPHVVDPRPPTHALPDPAFIDGLRKLGGIPEEILVHADLLALLLPIVRADLKLTQTYRYADGPPLDVPIEAYAGNGDPLASAAEVDAWRAQTTAGFELNVLAGGHFFIQSAQATFFSAVSQTVGRALLDLTEG